MIVDRQEVLSIHVPSESDEWMRLETSKLAQCTRIFPLELKNNDGKINDKPDEEDKEEQEENEDEMDEKQKIDSASKLLKSATYEEIIIQVKRC